MDKSHVALEQHVCPICTKHFDTGNVLLDRRLRKVFEHKATTGWGLCAECKKLFDDGYLALVEIDRSKSNGMKPDEVHRLGRIVHVRKSANVVPSEPGQALAWCDSEVIDKLTAMVQSLEGEGDAVPRTDA